MPHQHQRCDPLFRSDCLKTSTETEADSSDPVVFGVVLTAVRSDQVDFWAVQTYTACPRMLDLLEHWESHMIWPDLTLTDAEDQFSDIFLTISELTTLSSQTIKVQTCVLLCDSTDSGFIRAEAEEDYCNPPQLHEGEVLSCDDQLSETSRSWFWAILTDARARAFTSKLLSSS